MEQISFQLVSSLCHLPDLAETEDTDMHTNLVPVTKPQENLGKCWPKRYQEESRKLLPRFSDLGCRSCLWDLAGKQEVTS